MGAFQNTFGSGLALIAIPCRFITHHTHILPYSKIATIIRTESDHLCISYLVQYICACTPILWAVYIIIIIIIIIVQTPQILSLLFNKTTKIFFPLQLKRTHEVKMFVGVLALQTETRNRERLYKVILSLGTCFLLK